MKANVDNELRSPDVALFTASGEPSRTAKTPAKTALAAWLVPVGLLLLSAVPLAFGAFRISELTGGAEVTRDNVRFLSSPLPLVLHLASAGVYSILGAFQFATGFRRRWPGWHRAAGRLLVPCGLLVGLSALWMTLFYPRPDGTGVLLYVLRLVFGSAMVVSIVLGFAAIRRREIGQHSAWMMRAYAIGLGAGTQVLTSVIALAVLGPPNEITGALQMATSWLINLAVAEWAIRKRAAPAPRRHGMRRSARRSASLSAGNP